MDTEVLIVGAGPTGLTMANELRVAGVAAVLVDKLPQRSHLSKAGGVQSRTQQAFDQRGLLEPLLATGSYPAGVAHFAGIHLLRTRGRHRLPWRSIPQVAIEGFLEAHLAADARLDGAERAVTHSRTADGHWVGVFPLGTDPQGRPLFRLAIGGPGSLPRDVPVTEDEIRDSLGVVFGGRVRLVELCYARRITNAARQVARYRHQRVFLAGDAAHIHLPIGAQGMNLGIQDALNLGWKLGAAVHGWAPEHLLDTYHAERHPVGAAVLRNVQAQSLLMDTVSCSTPPVNSLTWTRCGPVGSTVSTVSTASPSRCSFARTGTCAGPDPILPGPNRPWATGSASPTGRAGKHLPRPRLDAAQVGIHEGMWIALLTPLVVMLFALGMLRMEARQQRPAALVDRRTEGVRPAS